MNTTFTNVCVDIHFIMDSEIKYRRSSSRIWVAVYKPKISKGIII